MSQPLSIVLTMGDAAGIGPETCLKVVQPHRCPPGVVPVVFGSRVVLDRVADLLQMPRLERAMSLADFRNAEDRPAETLLVDFDPCGLDEVKPGQIGAKTGSASFRFVDAAIQCAMTKRVDAIVTGPIHKEAWHAAGIRFPGHTELLAATTHAERYCMMLTSDELTCTFVTSHIGLAEVPRLVTRARVLEVIDLTARALGARLGRDARLLVCGLNPHAGEGGLFGDKEEENSIRPAVRDAQEAGIDVEGPVPADTAFLPVNRRRYDAFVCMYHDQGLAPLKALAFDLAVNVTLGLPIVRTSVDHGTALDIAWTGRADETSMCEAVRMAAQLAQSV